MSGLPAVSKGLWNLPAEERRKVYADLREALSLSATEPLLPLPEPALKAWAKRLTELMTPVLGKHPATRPLSDPGAFESICLQYAASASDEFCEAHMGPAQGLSGAGLAGIYIHTLMNTVGLSSGMQAAREVLTPEQRAIVEQRFPAALFLRHALLQEGAIGPRPANA
jgi:hypothetical protein